MKRLMKILWLVFQLLCGLWLSGVGIAIMMNKLTLSQGTYGFTTLCLGICGLSAFLLDSEIKLKRNK